MPSESRPRKCIFPPLSFANATASFHAVEAKIFDQLKLHIAGYAIPKEIIFRDALPKTLVGKVAFRKLEEEEEKLKEQEEEAKPEPTYAEQIAETFNESLENVKEFFKEAFLELVSVSIVLVPILVIVIIAVIIICVKISKYKKAKKAAAKKEEEDKVKKE